MSDPQNDTTGKQSVTVETFENLVQQIQQTHAELTAQANKAVNVSLTLRNWLIGYHISEHELRSSDRAQYGDQLFKQLAGQLKAVSNCNRRQLYRYVRFFRLYPAIVGTLPPKFKRLQIRAETLQNIDQTKVGTASPQSEFPASEVISRLSYSHLEQIVDLDDETKRAFYQIEAIQGNWSVRELKRQIASLYFERSGLSHNKQKLSDLAHHSAEQQSGFNIRDPYVFEFLGLTPTEVMSESDLVFYHRILKCHVLVELKLESFNHENLGQLNTYVSWYRANMMTDGDNPPIGILLCTDKNHALAHYALAGMDNQLFVSRYQLELPKTEDIQQFIDEQLQSLDPDKQHE